MDGEYVVELKGDAGRVVLAGEIDVLAAPGVLEAIDLALALRAGRILIDLGAVTFLDSAGIRAIVIGYQDAVRLGAGFAIGAVQPNVARILALTGLRDVLSAEPAVQRLTR